MSSIIVVFGTRPEVIKLAPVIDACKSIGLDVINVYTGQHSDLGASLLECFNIELHYDAAVMKAGQSINSLLARAISALDEILAREKPDAIVVQGDTSSALAGALSARFLNIPVVHVEAGMRTGDFREPFPEELNRCLISRVAMLHCAATRSNVNNLLGEGIDPSTIVETGNPIVDAIDRISASTQPGRAIRRLIEGNVNNKLIVATTHRRENFGTRLDGYLRVLGNFVAEHERVVLVYPVHPNPNVRKAVDKCLSKHERILLLEPMDYPDFIYLMRHASVVVSDSGGIQEEVASIGTPLLILRQKTERPEAIEAGVAKLVSNPNELLTELGTLVSSNSQQPALRSNPFGDGRSALRIAQAIARLVAKEYI
ncbi:MAG: UDP-N-acetylglucosamine 2-epimerase (non-hydrolyzing) [Gammaproteobacteria bacterium]|jgi:UDP-N-acetylglucosamine 2-epimerase (non-hydrolysing)